jgi:adenylate kinase family enzyme
MLARWLGQKFGLPVFHLDRVFWRPGWTAAPPEIFAAEVARIAALPAWVIDGNYTDTIAPRLRAADTVIYLDVPAWLSLARSLRRSFSCWGKDRPDGPEGCRERLDRNYLAFLWFVLTWNRTRRARTLAMVAGFAGEKIVTSRAWPLARP